LTLVKKQKQTVAVLALALGLIAAAPARAQVGSGLLDLNQAPEAELLKLPHVAPAVAKEILAKRPFGSITEAQAVLTASGLSAQQITELYGKAFVHVNLNTGSAQEIQLIPGAGRRMAHEFEEYRPWKSWAQFDKEIGKYVAKTEVERLKQYVFIPLKLNIATEAEFMTIPGVGKRMAHEFEEYRPWKTREQFQKEIGKYVDAKEVARLWRFVTLE
jgi:DNA uptake protein ComE-like DNA-binding protein